MTDHNVRETLAVTDRAYIINNGRIFRAGKPEALGRDPEVRRVYLGENFNLEFGTAAGNTWRKTGSGTTMELEKATYCAKLAKRSPASR